MMRIRSLRHLARRRSHKAMETRHETVLLQESVDALSVVPGDVVVDATLGGAGHFMALAQALGKEGTLVGIDADEDAIGRAQAAIDALPENVRPNVHLANANFRELARIMDEVGQAPTKVLFDLGWSAFHLTRGRGFSFKTDEPLLMTYGDPELGTTAADLVNHLSESSLADLLWSLGEERFAKSIARSIVRAREEAPLASTADLVRAVEEGTPGWYQRRRIHPATKTFQALRIAVNDELGALREGLSAALALVPSGGRIAVITFHSIEDRIVKTMFREAAEAGKGGLLTRKPLGPSSAEEARNPRARSAKLRVFVAGASPIKNRINLTSFPAYA